MGAAAQPIGATLFAMAEHHVELLAAWQGHVARESDFLEGVIARYREPHRRYHTVAHLTWVVRHTIDLARSEDVDDLGAVVAAAFYHDSVYAPLSPDNERVSARLARRDLNELGWAVDRADSVAMMIEGTADHADPPDTDTAVLFDADLAVLGSSPAAYDDYVTGVRREYEQVDDARWRQGRRNVLEAFLDRATIYATATAVDRWEHRARANLTAELALLTGSG